MTGSAASPTPPPVVVPADALAAAASGRTFDPHAVLGPHLAPDAGDARAVVRVLRPLADEVVVVTTDGEHAAAHEQDGVWAAVVPVHQDADGTRHAPDYRVRGHDDGRRGG